MDPAWPWGRCRGSGVSTGLHGGEGTLSLPRLRSRPFPAPDVGAPALLTGPGHYGYEIVSNAGQGTLQLPTLASREGRRGVARLGIRSGAGRGAEPGVDGGAAAAPEVRRPEGAGRSRPAV